jgi:hypothetical protein
MILTPIIRKITDDDLNIIKTIIINIKYNSKYKYEY